MPLQQKFDNVGTSAGPSWVNHKNALWMAWKGQGSDPRVFVGHTTSLRPNSDGDYAGFEAGKPIAGAQANSGPAIASLDDKLFLFWIDAQSGRVFVSTSGDGAAWSPAGALKLKGDKVPSSTAAVAAATGGDSLILSWKGHDDNAILWATLSNGAWGAQETVTASTGGQPLTNAAPALAVAGDTVHLAWQGISGGIFWTTHSGGSWAPQKQLFGASGGGPSLVTDGNGVVWMAWPGSPGGPPSPGNYAIMFASLGAKNKWSRQVQRFGVRTSDRIALASTGSDSRDIMMAWKGQADWDIYCGSLRLPPITYGFEMLQTRCDNMRSGSWGEKNEVDTDYASFGVQVIGKPANVQTTSAGLSSVTGGWYPIGLSAPAVTVEDIDVVIMTYTIVNKGSGTNILGTLAKATEAAIEAIASASDASITQELGVDLSAASAEVQATLLGAELGATIGAAVGAAWGGVGAAVGAVVGAVVGEIMPFADPNCDGPVANAYHYFNSETLRAQIEANSYLRQKERNPGITSQGGCGSDSLYVVDWIVSSGALPSLPYSANSAP